MQDNQETLEEYKKRINNEKLAKWTSEERKSSFLCIEGNCSGCQIASVCRQKAPYVETHLEEIIEATILKIKCCVEGLTKHMKKMGYTRLDDLRGGIIKDYGKYLAPRMGIKK